MLKIKEKGLKIEINPNNGLCRLTYIYPLKAESIKAIEELNISSIIIDTYKNTKRAVFTTTGDSISCFSAFKAVQKTLMIHSRLSKISVLNEELKRLQS